MKKAFCALATCAAAGSASAQASVTVFGLLDASISNYESTSKDSAGNTVKASRQLLNTNGLNASKLGFRGVEDLGGGLFAGFWLESHVYPDTGTVGANVANTAPAVTGFFSRRSTVSLTNQLGELRIGRDVTPTYWNDANFDPFGGVGLGTSAIVLANQFTTANSAANGYPANFTYARASNGIGYFLPDINGIYGQAMYTFHEMARIDGGTTANPAANSRAGAYWGVRFGYAKGPVDVAVSYGQSTVAGLGTTVSNNKINTFNFGGTYDFSVAKLYGEYSKADLKNVNLGASNAAAGNSPDSTGYLLGVTVPFGVSQFRLAYSKTKLTSYLANAPTASDPEASKWAVGYVYNLSKRTALYATYARLNNRNGYDLGNSGSPAYVTSGAQPRRSSGYDLGLRHAF